MKCLPVRINITHLATHQAPPEAKAVHATCTSQYVPVVKNQSRELNNQIVHARWLRPDSSDACLLHAGHDAGRGVSGRSGVLGWEASGAVRGVVKSKVLEDPLQPFLPVIGT
jgi:hypothetical protein